MPYDVSSGPTTLEPVSTLGYQRGSPVILNYVAHRIIYAIDDGKSDAEGG